MEILRNLWQSIPVWLRSVLLETVEAIGAALLAYGITLLESSAMGNPVEWNVVLLESIIAKAILKTLRAHPEIPIRDWVNLTKPDA